MAGKRPREQKDEPKPDSKRLKKAPKPAAVPLKALTATRPAPPPPSVPAAEIDFPRGGGSSFTPLESKAIRQEAIQELKDEQIFKEGEKPKAKSVRKQASSKALNATKNAEADKDRIRVEHLNYKRLVPGQRLLCQITTIHPLALVVSLPNQLLGHIPITHISPLLTERLEKMDQEDSSSDKENQDENDDEEKSQTSDVPDLEDLFRVGQYVTAIVEEVRPAGARESLDYSKNRDEATKASRRVELSISPEKVNAGVSKSDLKPGFNISAVVKSVEDHGYILDLGVSGVSGFVSLKEAKKGPFGDTPLSIGQVISTSVLKMSENGRTVTLSVDASVVKGAIISEVSSVTAVLPGTLVSGLITAVLAWGLNVQILGFFGGTLDLFHLPPPSSSITERYKVGQKIRARVLWDVTSNSPRTFALSALPHVLSLSVEGPTVGAAGKDKGKAQSVKDAFPAGTVLDAVKVVRVESEWGLVLEAPGGAQGFAHIANVSDEHVPSLSESSGIWKVGSTHRARVIGFSPIDGLLQLTLKPSVIEQKYLHTTDLTVGETVKGTVKSLSELGLFVSISETVDGVVWPMHYSDIRLKNPERKFKVGGPVKCRVINVDGDRNRVTLTLKKSLLESELPIIKTFEDATVGLVTHAVVAKILPKNLIINFLGGLRGSVSLREASDDRLSSFDEAFTIGQVVRARVISIDAPSSRIVASIRQAAPNYVPPVLVSSIPKGSIISESRVVEVQKDNIALTLLPTNVRALVSINNLAARRGVTAAQLRSEGIKSGDLFTDPLVVVSVNEEKNFVIVSASAPPSAKSKSSASTVTSADDLPSVDFASLKEGDLVKGKITTTTLKQGVGCGVRVSNDIVGSLNPMDVVDDLKLLASSYPPAVGKVLDFAILSIDTHRRRLVLSTRPSRLNASSTDKKGKGKSRVVDPEIAAVADLERGQKVRGVVKSVADAGLFVTIGRGIDARVQIKELFDDYVKDWKARFSVNEIVEARVFKVDVSKNQVELTMRSRDLSKVENTGVTYDTLVEGENVDGVVKKVELYGLFIEIQGTKISGLCHKSELSDNKKSDVASALRLFKEGDSVRARILTVDVAKKRVNFGLKPSYFVDDPAAAADAKSDDEAEDDKPAGAADEGSDDEDSDAEEDEGEDESDGDDEEMDDGDIPAVSEDDEDEEEADADSDVIMEDDSSSQAAATAPVMLQLQRGFEWGSKAAQPTDGHSDIPSSDESDAEAGAGASKGRKKRKKHEIQKDLTNDMHTKTPESTSDFERLLLGSPNSSFLWIQYMSFQLQLSEIDKAREIGRRAISAINFREEQERLNVWIARLNLENSYGTDETLEATFRDAAKHHEAKHMHLRLAAILEQTDKHEKAEELFKRTTKKFGQSSKVWTSFGEHYFNRKSPEEARKLLPRSLQSLEKRKHLKTVSKFAQMEYKLGDPERGKTIFEGIIDSHPKRLDLWSVYIDMEAGQNDIQSIRTIFDRVFTQKLSSKKAKFFFKKWLALERSIGDDSGAELVKSRAIAWTQGTEPVHS